LCATLNCRGADLNERGTRETSTRDYAGADNLCRGFLALLRHGRLLARHRLAQW
jgi:hypothetical protein